MPYFETALMKHFSLLQPCKQRFIFIISLLKNTSQRILQSNAQKLSNRIRFKHFFLGIKVYVIDIDIISVKVYSNKKELLFGIRLGCVLESLINIVKRLLKLT